MKRWLWTAMAVGTAVVLPRVIGAQERGAAAVAELVQALGQTARVLVIAAHPDDEDTQLITWLARGRGVETAYLSLTRGDGGQNLIGNELGEALGVIRTEELLAARRIDGGKQYFTRAYDFGFSKTAEETYKHWPKDSILGDVVRVVRAFRPHVIVTVFSGTPRDGHGHHQVSGLLGREAYDVSGDTVQFPVAAFGAPWTVSKFYRGSRFNITEGTLTLDVGTYSPLRGRSYGELSGESRSQHKSQGFGVLQRKGPMMDSVRRDATRVNASTDAKSERDLLDGIETGWSRFRGTVPTAMIDSLVAAVQGLQQSLDVRSPAPAVAVFQRAIAGLRCRPSDGCTDATAAGRDFATSWQIFSQRRFALHELATGLAVEATAARGVAAIGAAVPVTVTLFNRGARDISIDRLACALSGDSVIAEFPQTSLRLAAGASATVTIPVMLPTPAAPWWLATPRRSDIWSVPIQTVPGGAPTVRDDESRAAVVRVIATGMTTDSVPQSASTTVAYRFADPVRGDVQRPLRAAPAVTVTLDRAMGYARANQPFARTVRVTVRSAAADTQVVRVVLSLPVGLSSAAASQMVRLAPAASVTAEFAVQGRLAAGTHQVTAAAFVGDTRFASGFTSVDYEHIRPQQLFRPAELTLTAVDVALPAKSRVAYIAGVGDNVFPLLEELGLSATRLDAAALPTADLDGFTAIVVGPRAYESNDALVANNARLLEYAKRGGTLVVQYGQFEMQRPGILPYPITLGRPADRVTEEDAAMRIVAPGHRLLTTPNRITERDWEGWVQERALYMPRTFDPAYTALVSSNDANEPPRDAGILVAPVGKGVFVYTTLSFFRQLPAGNAGAARLFVNLVGAKPDAVRPATQ